MCTVTVILSVIRNPYDDTYFEIDDPLATRSPYGGAIAFGINNLDHIVGIYYTDSTDRLADGYHGSLAIPETSGW